MKLTRLKTSKRITLNNVLGLKSEFTLMTGINWYFGVHATLYQQSVALICNMKKD